MGDTCKSQRYWGPIREGGRAKDAEVCEKQDILSPTPPDPPPLLPTLLHSFPPFPFPISFLIKVKLRLQDVYVYILSWITAAFWLAHFYKLLDVTIDNFFLLYY